MSFPMEGRGTAIACSFPTIDRRGPATVFQPLRYALRQLRNSPGFATVAILILALGIGATTTIFSVLDAVLLQPLPFPHPDRLVAIVSVPDENLSWPTARDMQQRGHSFESITVYRGWAPTVHSTGGVENGRVLEVSQNFFATLGAHFVLGGDLPQTGNERDCTGQAIVSGLFWKRLGGGSRLDARTLQIDRRSFQITGVLPISETIEGHGVNRPDVFLPTGCDPWQQPNNRGSADYWAIGRLRPGVSIKQADADLARVWVTLQKDFTNIYPSSIGKFPTVISWMDKLSGEDTRPALLAILSACGLLLLIASANLANLLLARSVRRRQEFATRATLGASLGQLLRQLMLESAVLAAAGTALGIALAYAALRLLLTIRAAQMPRLENASINTVVLAFAIAATLLVTVLLTMLPARRILRPELLRDLAGAGRTSGSRSLRLAGRVLVAVQIAFAFVLLAGAGWMVATIYQLVHQPLGFDPNHLVVAGVDIDGTSVTPRYDGPRTNLFFNELVARLRTIPGVESAAATNHPPLGHAINRYSFASDRNPSQWTHPAGLNPDSYHVTPGYFATVEQPMLAGRDFTAADNGANHVAIVNQALAAREWPGESALGHRVRTGDIQGWATVVGVVGNVHSHDLDDAPGPDLYLPQADNPQTGMSLIVRTAGDPALFKKTLRSVIQSGHADLSLYNLQTMDEEMEYETGLRRFLMQVAVAFGLLALLIAVLGTYGLLAYEVSLREKEIGIRLALGSPRQAIVRLLLRQESRWIGLGALFGLLASSAVGVLLESRLYHARAASLPVLAAALTLLVGPALLAIALPARQAAMLDPVDALRSE